MTAPVSATQMAHQRRMEEERMVDRADIISRARTASGAGGSILTETTRSDVPCYREPNLAGNSETPFGGQLQSGLQWKFVFPFGTAIGNDDEIIYGVERFAVMGTLGPRTYETARRVICVEKAT